MKFAALKSVTHVSILTSDMVSKNSINWSAFHFNINYGSNKGGGAFQVYFGHLKVYFIEEHAFSQHEILFDWDFVCGALPKNICYIAIAVIPMKLDKATHSSLKWL